MSSKLVMNQASLSHLHSKFTLFLYCIHQLTERAIRKESVGKLLYLWHIWTLDFTMKPQSCRVFLFNHVHSASVVWVFTCCCTMLRFQNSELLSIDNIGLIKTLDHTVIHFEERIFEITIIIPEHDLITLWDWLYEMMRYTLWQTGNHKITTCRSQHLITKLLKHHEKECFGEYFIETYFEIIVFWMLKKNIHISLLKMEVWNMFCVNIKKISINMFPVILIFCPNKSF